jgi:hypothetical protein
MAEKIKLEVVTPKGAIVSEEVDIVTAPVLPVNSEYWPIMLPF